MNSTTPASARSQRSFAALRQRARGLVSLAAAAILVAACGGSADAPPPPDVVVVVPPPPAPGSAPALTQQPASACLAAPGIATFTAIASANPAATVQWQRSVDSGATWAAIAGATGASYSTPATAFADDNTRFRAVFANAVGSATSLGATLNVMNPTPSRLSVLAGNAGGSGNLDGCSAAARFNNPQGVAVDSAGNVYVADTGNQTVRRITTANGVATLAGRTGIGGTTDGTGAAATFSDPVGIAVDASGNVFVADSTGPTIRRITPTGVVSTVAGQAGHAGSANGQGTAATFMSPFGMAFDAAGNLYVVDQGSFAVRRITPAGVVSTFASLTDATLGSLIGNSIALDASGNVYVGGLRGPQDDDGDISYDEAEVWRFKATGEFDRVFAGAAPGSSDGTGTAAAFNYPSGLAADAAGNVYVGDLCNDQIRKITPAAVVTTLAGSVGEFRCDVIAGHSVDGTGAAAIFNEPAGVALEPGGSIVVADSGNNVIRRVAANGSVMTIAGTASDFGTSDGVGAAARFHATAPGGYAGYSAIDAAGNVYVTDTLSSTIRKIAPDGTVSTFAGMAPSSDFTFPIADGVGTAAVFSIVEGMTIDAAGNLYVIDFDGNDLRKITPAAVVTTVAHHVGNGLPWGVAVDGAGNFFVTDPFANAINKVTPAGTVSVLTGGTQGSADGSLATARFNLPQGIVADASGNLYVADTDNHTIRKITPAGVVSTLAGTAGVIGHADGIGAAASFNAPLGVAVDAAGNVYVADTGNDEVRRIAPDGTTTTLIGSVSQSGVRADSAERLSQPYGISVRGRTLIVLSGYAVLRYDLP